MLLTCAGVWLSPGGRLCVLKKEAVMPDFVLSPLLESEFFAQLCDQIIA